MESESIPNLNNTNTKGPWGPWATLGFTLVIIAAMAGVQLLAVLLYFAYRTAAGLTTDLQSVATNGTFLSIATILTGLVCLSLAVLFAWIRKGPSAKDYLAIVPIGRRKHLVYLAIGLGFAVLTDLTNLLLDRPIIPEFVEAAYTSTSFKPLLWFAICIVAPVYEEIVFRGFALAGFQRSRLGATGAVVLVSLLWSSLHVQYELFLMAQVFLLGLVIGAVRIKSGSVFPAIGVHMLINTIAMIETAIYLGW
jgi:membrane protease YdiL (CAAX protease family)